ncbi:hypothetical protein BC830DRAFT_1175232 [Chytriomyces sp. MP71]|nr:hypothetical protein BC830DRAFT_1175232 [Chytriomyces sp. MP71]
MSSASKLQMTSDDVNYLVWRYLLESGGPRSLRRKALIRRRQTGFSHSTFAFAAEAQVHSGAGRSSALAPPQRGDDVRGSRVAPGALVACLFKALQYQEVETHTTEDGVTIKKCTAPFSLTHPHECVIDTSLDTDEASGAADAHTVPSKRKKHSGTADDSVGSKRERKEAKRLEREKRARKESVLSELGSLFCER